MKRQISIFWLLAGALALVLIVGAVWWFGYHGAEGPLQTVHVGGKKMRASAPAPQLAAVQKRMAEAQQLEQRVAEEQAVSEGLSDWFGRFEGVIGKGTLRERTEALKMILARGDEAEIARLYQFLAKSDPGKKFASLGRLGLASLQNSIMDYAVNRDPKIGRGADALLQIASDRQHEAVARNYAYQHLDGLYARVDGLDGQEPQHYQQRILKVLEQGLGQSDGNVAGTSLLALYRIRKDQEQGWDDRQLAAQSLKMATDKNTDELARGTALWLAAGYQQDGVLPTARKLAQQGANSAQQATALAVLGKLGTQEDVKQLTVTAESGKYPLNVAAQAALQTMRQRGVIQ